MRGLPDNAGLPATSLLTKAALDGRVGPLVRAQQGTINSEELMPWASYQARFAPNGTMHGIGSQRMVWVVVATFPNGLQTGLGGYGAGTKVVAVFDAQTGQGISETYQGPLVQKKVRLTTPTGSRTRAYSFTEPDTPAT
jgi:hypothetical protein